MIHAHVSKQKSAPRWAVFGAPLFGVPLMVGLLALAAPDRHVVGAEPEGDVTIEEVETVDWSADGGEEAPIGLLPIRC